MRRLTLPNLALVCALLLLNLPVARAQKVQTTGTATVSTVATGALPAATLDAAKVITAARLSEHLHVVASDAMEGRDTPSRGLDETAKYVATHLKRFGLKPAGDEGTFFQRIALIRQKVDPARTTAEFDSRAFKFGQDFLSSGTSGTANGALVFADHGWVIKSKNLDAYKGIEVRDKIVIIAGTGLPAGVTRADIKGKVGDDWEDPEAYARRNGAKGLIVVPRTRNFERWWGLVRSGVERGAFEMERFATSASGQQQQQQVPTLYPSAAMLDALFADESVSGADIFKGTQASETRAAFALSESKRVKFSVVAMTERQTTQNVVAVLEGEDATLKNEYVAVGAHYDHVGMGLPVNGDALYNGADDDGSGTVAVLSLAEAFSRAPRLARSLLFVWHAGEEQGLWGSQYFTTFPTVPLERIVAQLNIDMIGRSKKEGDTKPENRDLSGPHEIYVIGSKLMSTALGDLSERVNRAYLNLAFNYKYDDPRDSNRFFFRSDHFNYAQRGIPIIFYFDGVHEDYHRPSDTVDKIDFQKMEKVTRTVFLTAAELAGAPTRPRVDKQLPAELTGR
ncbi:MAG: M28 family peptidase [Pyrinomonadaceae bacterium]